MPAAPIYGRGLYAKKEIMKLSWLSFKNIASLARHFLKMKAGQAARSLSLHWQKCM